MKILVTGLSGFVGRYLEQELLDHGHEVVDLNYSSDPVPAFCDIRDFEKVRSAILNHRPEALIHLAGIADTHNGVTTDQLFEVNVTGTANICRAAAELGNIRVLHVSSGIVFGSPTHQTAFNEAHVPRPPHRYSQSKLASEEVARLFACDSAFDLYIARPFNHIGPGQRVDFVSPALAAKIKHAPDPGVIEVGNLETYRDFTDVRDIVRAYRLMIESAPSEKLFVLGSGKPTKIKDVFDYFVGLSGKSIDVRVKPKLLKHGDPPTFYADASLAKEVLDWEPRIPLRTSLKDVYESVPAT